MNKESAKKEYFQSNNASLAIRNYGMGSATSVETIFIKYGLFMGIGVGLIIMILSYILYGILALVRLTKFKLTNLILNFLAYLFMLIFGFELVFLENRYTTLANAIIAYIGYPLFYTSIIVLIFITTFIVLSIIKKDVKA